MRRQVTKYTIRMARRHPQKALKVAKFAGRHRKGIAGTIQASRKANQVVALLKETAAQPKVQAEVRAAVAELSTAAARARKLGPIRALDDKKVAKGLGKAGSHAKAAWSQSGRRKRGHFGGRALLGFSAIAVSYGSWRAFHSSDS